MFLLIVIVCSVIGGAVGAAVAGGGGFIFGGFIGLTFGVIVASAQVRRKSPSLTPVARQMSQLLSGVEPEVPQNIEVPVTPVPSLATGKFSQRQRPVLRWVEPSELIPHGGFQISSGLFYVCDGVPELGEASAVNQR